MSEKTRQELCNVLGITDSELETSRYFEVPEKELGKPCLCKEIIADGNCFLEQYLTLSVIHKTIITLFVLQFAITY